MPCCRVFDVVVFGEDEGDFLPGEARDLRLLELVLLEDFFQPGIVPLALDFVEGHVEELFFLLIKVYHADLCAGVAKVLQHGEALVAAYDVAGALIPDDGLDVPERLYAVLEPLELRHIRGEGDAGVIVGGYQPRKFNFLYLHSCRPPCVSRGSGLPSGSPSRCPRPRATPLRPAGSGRRGRC